LTLRTECKTFLLYFFVHTVCVGTCKHVYMSLSFLRNCVHIIFLIRLFPQTMYKVLSVLVPNCELCMAVL
jgi:hypothetical protein